MMVKVIFPSIIGKVTGERHIVVSAENMREVLKKLVDIYGEPFKKIVFEDSGELNRYLTIFIKGRSISGFDVLDAKLNKNDEVVIMVIILGG
jgi:molybdopterin converting factor small subunit